MKGISLRYRALCCGLLGLAWGWSPSVWAQVEPDTSALAPMDSLFQNTALPDPVDPEPEGDIDLIPGVEYTIERIDVAGSGNLDQTVIVLLSGLSVGDRVTFPGEMLQKAIRKLWDQKLFDDVSISVTQKRGNSVVLEIGLVELPKLSKFGIFGVKKSQKDKLREELKLSRGLIVTDNLKYNTRNRIRKYYRDKGYLDADARVEEVPDTTLNNAVLLNIFVEPGPRIRIKDIRFEGNENIKSAKLRKAMKETKRKRLWTIFKSSKLIREDYQADQKLLLDLYNEQGFRDARIVSDTIRRVSKDRVLIEMKIEEGRRYYFRDIAWLGNTKYPNEVLDKILRIRKGDIYDAKLLQERLFFDKNGNDITSLYLDNGYLFFNLNPVETRVEGDSIDFEMRIREGRQATINKVTVSGNDRTNDHVVMRELRTRPGELFSRSDIQRSMRELAQLNFFDPTALDVSPVPNAETGTVDIEYKVVEKSTSQLELQGGWGGGRVVATVGLSFNNFSARNLFNGKAWKPLPSGDGQTISLRAQTNGAFFQSYSLSFTEPWLGGKKPNSLTVSIFHNIQTNGLSKSDPGRQELAITSLTLGLGRRLKWPDDYFTLYTAVEYQVYRLRQYTGLSFLGYQSGQSNSLNFKFILGRNNTDVPIFPTQGSNLSLGLELTPPFSQMGQRELEDAEARIRYEWIEYHKWKFSGSFYTQMAKNLVLHSRTEFGLLGFYNPDIGLPPFERFYVGGDGLQNFVIDGREIIGLRGYPNSSLSSAAGDPLYTKFIFELRYLVSPNPQATVYVQTFAEGGNSYRNFETFNPFLIKRSLGAGVRIFMPMFGLLGIDFAYGFDPLPGGINPSGWQTHFIIGQQF
ncbi:outer membrane protein assembly factor BamA [bacterium]|nr:outer membrane protein assembly factor BamA [bacterium]